VIAQSDVHSKLIRLRCLLAAATLEIRAELLARALKANFNPNQPRVPAGQREGGQWTDAGSDSESTVGDQSTIVIASRPRSPAREAYCWAQYERDIFQCRMVGL
jgi:hypothetical protein